MTLEEIMNLKGVPLRRDANLMKVKCYVVGNDPAAAEEFNSYYLEVMRQKWTRAKRTKSGGISIDKKNFRPPMYYIKQNNSGVEMGVFGYGKMLRIQFRQKMESEDDKTVGIYGRQAISAFKDILLKHGVELDDYIVADGPEIKKTIEKYMISLCDPGFKGLTVDGCHHIDFHSSFSGGLANTHPEFRPALNETYLGRKEKPINKAILNLSIGWFHSLDNCGAQWAPLARDAIADNNKRLRELSDRLTEAGRVVLLYNTDGIWYQGEIYHGEGEGKGLGEWENDHTNCRLRAKSAGAYEFIEDGKYHPVIRGQTNLDLIKPRDQWEWGDIMRKETKPILYEWDELTGIIIPEEAMKIWQEKRNQ